MDRSYAILFLIVLLTILGDYSLKVAAKLSEPFVSFWFFKGVLLYGFTAVGWTFLMQTHSLAQIAVVYSSVTILALILIGYFLFGEAITRRQGLGVAAAFAAVVLVNT